MTAQPATFWNRLLTAVRIRPRQDKGPDGLPNVGDDGLLADPIVDLPGDADAEAVTPDKAPVALSRWNKRDQTLAKLQEGYEQVTRVVQEIQNHLVAQADRSERMCVSLEQLAQSVTELPSIGREQTQTLETMAARMEATNTRTQQMAESLSEVPKLARTQSETLTGINRHLEMASEQSVMTSQTLDKIGSAMGTLSTASQTQTERLRMIGDSTDEHMDLLTQMLARQNRRFVMLFVVTVVLAVAAIAAIAVMMLSARSG
jgi:hypothetical protein